MGFVGGFDGIRGFGILLVLGSHAYSDLSPSFAAMIDIFFVLSAFLIVTLLMQEHRDHQFISLRKFYARRAIRLLPSAYLCLVAWFVIYLIFDRDRLDGMVQDALAAFFYVYNIIFPVGMGTVDPNAFNDRSIDHFWSLAVEEQFYLVAAITTAVCLAKRWMVPLALGLMALAAYIGWQRWLGHMGPWNNGIPTNDGVLERGFSLLWLSRYDALMWGVALAVLNAHMADPIPKRIRQIIMTLGGIGLAIAMWMLVIGSPFLADTFGKLGLPFLYVPMFDPTGQADMVWVQFGHTVTAIAILPTILAFVRCKDWIVSRAFSWSPIRFLGRMSYTVYVWHTLFYYIILQLLGGDEFLGEKWRVPILAAAALIMSLPIYFQVEQRMLRIKLQFSTEKQVVDLNTGKMVDIEDIQKPRSRRLPRRGQSMVIDADGSTDSINDSDVTTALENTSQHDNGTHAEPSAQLDSPSQSQDQTS